MQERQENMDTIMKNLGTALLLGLFFLLFSSLQNRPVASLTVPTHLMNGSEMQLDNPAALIQETRHSNLLNHSFNPLPSPGKVKITGEVHPAIVCSNHAFSLMLKQSQGDRVEKRPFLHQKHCPQQVHQNADEPPVLI